MHARIGIVALWVVVSFVVASSIACSEAIENAKQNTLGLPQSWELSRTDVDGLVKNAGRQAPRDPLLLEAAFEWYEANGSVTEAIKAGLAYYEYAAYPDGDYKLFTRLLALDPTLQGADVGQLCSGFAVHGFLRDAARAHLFAMWQWMKDGICPQVDWWPYVVNWVEWAGLEPRLQGRVEFGLQWMEQHLPSNDPRRLHVARILAARGLRDRCIASIEGLVLSSSHDAAVRHAQQECLKR